MYVIRSRFRNGVPDGIPVGQNGTHQRVRERHRRSISGRHGIHHQTPGETRHQTHVDAHGRDGYVKTCVGGRHS